VGVSMAKFKTRTALGETLLVFLSDGGSTPPPPPPRLHQMPKNRALALSDTIAKKLRNRLFLFGFHFSTKFKNDGVRGSATPQASVININLVFEPGFLFLNSYPEEYEPFWSDVPIWSTVKFIIAYPDKKQVVLCKIYPHN